MSDLQLKELIEDVKAIKICLMGDLEKEECGLKAEVKSLSKWRYQTNKILFGILGCIGYYIITKILPVIAAIL